MSLSSSHIESPVCASHASSQWFKVILQHRFISPAHRCCINPSCLSHPPHSPVLPCTSLPQVYFRRITASASAQQSEEREYVGTVRDVQLNQSLAVVLTDSKATLHPIECTQSSAVRSYPYIRALLTRSFCSDNLYDAISFYSNLFYFTHHPTPSYLQQVHLTLITLICRIKHCYKLRLTYAIIQLFIHTFVHLFILFSSWSQHPRTNKDIPHTRRGILLLHNVCCSDRRLPLLRNRSKYAYGCCHLVYALSYMWIHANDFSLSLSHPISP